MDVTSGDPPSITVYYDSGCSAVLPTHYVKLQYGASFNGAWFEAPQASLEFIVDHASDPTSKLYTNANRALRKLLPVWQKKAWQSAKISSFLSTIANSAVSSTNLISRFNSSQLERLVWFCLRSSSVVSESNSEKQESLPNDPNTEISVECLELIKPSEDSLQMSASDKPSVENDSSLEQFVETLQAVPETNPVPPVPAAKEDFSDEAFRGMFTSVILFDSVPAPQVKLSALQNDALEGLSKEDLLKTFSEENLEHLSKSELSLLIQKAPPEFLAKLTEILQGALQITFAREILLDVLQSSTSPMPEIYVDLMRKFYLLFRLVSAGRVSGYPRKFVKPIIRRMIANGASPEFDPVRFFHTQALAELLHLVVGYEQRAHQLKSDLVPPDYEMLYILLRVLKTRAEPTLVGELFLIVEHKLPQTVKALLLQEACNLIKTANLASSRVLEDILESVKQSESQPFERMIPKIAFSTFENLGGSASKKSICSYSPFFQSLLSIMLCLPAAWQYEGEPLLGPRWDWWNEYSLSIQTYWALKNRSEFPSGFIKSVRGLLREIDLFDENETLMCLDNFYWSKQMDQQLVRWTTEHPEDWSRPIDVYLFGCGHSGQLAEASDPFKTHPVYVDSFALIQPTQVSCGSMCTFALAEDGSVHCCGKGEYGRLGTGSNDNQRTLTQLTSIQNIIIKRLSASKGSYGHTLAVDETGQIWSWGDGDYGKLGHGNSTQCPKPKPIEALRGKFITRVACGFKHSACVTLEGELYTWGMGDYGRLGHGGANETQNLPKRVEALSNTLIVEVACGSAHTLAVADNRTSVYSWGDGDYGKLGHGDTNGKTLPTLIELLSVYTIKRVEAGDEFSVALTDSGRVLSWGRNNANVLGHGDEGHLNVPLIITTLEPFTIIEISVGASHCIALTDQRRVYTWGSNEDGQLGLGHKNPVNVPQLVESLKNKKVRQVSAGSSHSAVWTSEPIDGRQSISLPFVIPLEYTLIQHVPIKQIAQRLSLLQHFSDMTLNNLVFCNVEQSILGLGLDELPKYLLPKSKTTVLRKQLSKTAYFDADITIQLDGCTEDIFTAMFLQLATLDPKELRASSRPYKIRFDGDLADDYDGIQEECMDQLQVGSGGLLQVTPNGINETGVNRDVQIFSNENVNQKLAKFRFFGRILGSAIRTKVPTQLYLAHVVYEMLAGKKLDLEDLREIDCDSLNCLEFIRTIEQFNVDRHNFHDIVPSNYFPPLINEHFEQVELHFDTRHEYVRLALEKHLNSWKIPTQQVWLGIRDIVPVPLLHLLTARDLEEYIAVPYSGSDGLVWEDLPLTCEVQGFPSDPEYEIEPVETDPGNLAGNPLMHIYLKYKKGSKHIENRKHRLLVWFWDAVEKFTSYEKGLFCRMVGGSTRPYWERLVIRYQASGLPEETIPFSPELYTLILPNYSSEVDLVRNLRKALHRV
jgi:alpha-tubulin suppressor-like RCC1 family protein